MTPDRALERLHAYEQELHSIQSRFCENRVRHDTARFQSVSRFGHAPWVFAAVRLLRAVAYRSGRCVSSCRRLTSADFFAVRRFVRFIQPAPNPALKRTCAKNRAARLALR
jgi:hypothetical protein